MKQYYDSPEEQEQLKKMDSQGFIWHRTGDIGQFDKENRLWLLGRYSQSLIGDDLRIYNGQLESQMEDLPGIRRAALIIKKQKQHLVLEPFPNENPSLELIEKTLKEMRLSNLSFSFTSNQLPVDPRHRWKIQKNKIKSKVF